MALDCKRTLPAELKSMYIREIKIEVWRSYHKRQAAVCG